MYSYDELALEETVGLTSDRLRDDDDDDGNDDRVCVMNKKNAHLIDSCYYTVHWFVHYAYSKRCRVQCFKIIQGVCFSPAGP